MALLHWCEIKSLQWQNCSWGQGWGKTGWDSMRRSSGVTECPLSWYTSPLLMDLKSDHFTMFNSISIKQAWKGNAEGGFRRRRVLKLERGDRGTPVAETSELFTYSESVLWVLNCISINCQVKTAQLLGPRERWPLTDSARDRPSGQCGDMHQEPSRRGASWPSKAASEIHHRKAPGGAHQDLDLEKFTQVPLGTGKTGRQCNICT